MAVLRQDEPPSPERPHEVRLIGGPYDGLKTAVDRLPLHIEIGGDWYDRIDDPDTHEPLGGYAYCESRPR